MSGHIFRRDPDLGTDWLGQPYCADCNRPKRNEIHVDPPDRPPEDVSARIAGEHDDIDK